LFEYKSSHDVSRKGDLSKLMGYLGLYCEQQKIGIEQIKLNITLWYIIVTRPSYFTKLIQNKIFIKTATKSLYRLNLPFPCSYYLMIINELDISEENLPLLLLSSGETLKKTVRLIAQKNIKLSPKLEKYLCFMYFINYEEVHNMTELQSILPKKIQKNIKLAIEDIGLKEVINLIGLKEVIKVAGLEEVIKVAGLEEVIKIAGLEEVIKVAGLEEVEKILHKLKRQEK
ncbi:MAG: hypothetical protein ACTSO9_14045, partial [Candidatus Helarchaeota archaeon]